MKNAASYRITAFTCFYFAFVCLFSYFRTWNWLPAITVALIFIFSMIGAHVKPLPLRVLVSLVPFAPAVYATLVPGDFIMAVILAVPALFNVIMLTAGRDIPPLYRLRHEFYVLAGICFLLSVMLLVTWLNPLLHRWPAFVYIGGCMLFGILELRAARAGQTGSVRWQAGNAGFFLLPVTVSAVIGVGLMIAFEYLVNWLAQFFYDEGVEAVHSSPSPIYVDTAIRVDPPVVGASTAVPVPLETSAPSRDANMRTYILDWRWIAIGVILIAACVLLIYFLTRKKKSDLTKQEELDLSLEREIANAFSIRRNDMPEDDFNRAKVRELYRRYMQYLRSRGITIIPSETTHDISDSALSVTDDDTALRTVYRLSRYDRDAAITDEDVKFAEECYLRLVSYQKEDTTKTT